MIISETSRRVCTTRAQQAAKPGRQIITFLLFGLQPEVLDSLGTLWRGAQARFAEVRWWRWVLCLGDGRDAAVSDATRMTRNALDGVSSLRMSAGGVPGSE